MIIVKYEYGRVVGSSLSDFHCLGYRRDAEGDLPYDGESWVVHGEADVIHRMTGGASWYLGIWRSQTRTVYVTDAEGKVLRGTPSGVWSVDALPFSPRGVFGIDDGCVLAWGADGDQPRAALWNGAAWATIPDPPDHLWAAHGAAPDLIYGVGENGLIARWDGHRWLRSTSPVIDMLVGVFVVGPDEMYACSSSGRVLEGSVYGWSHMLDQGMRLSDIAKWNDGLWVAAPNDGLLRLDGRRFENVKPNIKAEFLCAGEQLLISASDMIAATADGNTYRATPLSDFAGLFTSLPPTWVAEDTDFEEEPI